MLDRIEAEAGNGSQKSEIGSQKKAATSSDLRLPTSDFQSAEGALLSVTVLDPACGSGHFLLAAARRIATRLARVRAGGNPAPADYRHALRDVARACIYGVDRNPMAVELTSPMDT